MAAPMGKRTKAMLAVGLAILVTGAGGAAYVGTRGPDGKPAKVDVYYAATRIDAGTAGSVAVADGRLRAKPVAVSAVPPNAVIDPVQLSGRVAAAAIVPGTVVTIEMFPPPQTRVGSVVIPPGKRALALALEPVRGVAGFVGSGDRVDIYSVTRSENVPPGVRLVLQGIEVLNVNGAGLPAAQGQAAGPSLVYLLAVSPAEAERLIYLTEFEVLYLDLVAKGEPPVATPGAGPAQALQVL